MNREAPHAIDAECLSALQAAPVDLPELPAHLLSDPVMGKQLAVRMVPEHVF